MKVTLLDPGSIPGISTVRLARRYHSLLAHGKQLPIVSEKYKKENGVLSEPERVRALRGRAEGESKCITILIK